MVPTNETLLILSTLCAPQNHIRMENYYYRHVFRRIIIFKNMYIIQPPGHTHIHMYIPKPEPEKMYGKVQGLWKNKKKVETVWWGSVCVWAENERVKQNKKDTTIHTHTHTHTQDKQTYTPTIDKCELCKYCLFSLLPYRVAYLMWRKIATEGLPWCSDWSIQLGNRCVFSAWKYISGEKALEGKRSVCNKIFQNSPN